MLPKGMNFELVFGCWDNTTALFQHLFFCIDMTELYTTSEKSFMENAFGQDYLDYKKKVRRYL